MMTVADYLDGPEEQNRMELLWGKVVRSPSPRFGHQSIVTRATVILDQHVRSRGLGLVCVSPMDVVLDQKRFVVVQPDLFFVSNARAGIVRDRVWGAPDLVVEVLSRRTAAYDRSIKSVWYRDYGVSEFWLIDPDAWQIEILDFGDRPQSRAKTFSGEDLVVSSVLPELNEKAAQFFS